MSTYRITVWWHSHLERDAQSTTYNDVVHHELRNGVFVIQRQAAHPTPFTHINFAHVDSINIHSGVTK